MYSILAFWHDYPGSVPEPLSPNAEHSLEVFLFSFGIGMLVSLLLTIASQK